MTWRLLFAVTLGFFTIQIAPGQGYSPSGNLTLPKGITVESLADPKVAATVAEQLEKTYPPPRSEAARMLIAILRGSQLNGSDGWFGPAQSRYSWSWLVTKNGQDAQSPDAQSPDAQSPDAQSPFVRRDQFQGPLNLFDQIDRDGDGRITPTDLDWSDRNPFVMQSGIINRVFRRIETSGNGRLTREEWDAFFQSAAMGKDFLSAYDLRGAVIPRGPMGFSPGDAPSVPVLVKGLFAGEIGSISEGPSVGATAPDFGLKTADGKQMVTLSKVIGPKPVVLVFGNFTCGPFRSLYPDVESLYAKHKENATFLMVYVREAHPTDGWKMDSNGKMGVSVKQPTTLGERVEACEMFQKKLQPGMPVLVDELSDPVGTAYSGMPARLYVIDTQGKVAYKSGRGPFGFKPMEMEQALVMSLWESEKAKKTTLPKAEPLTEKATSQPGPIPLEAENPNALEPQKGLRKWLRWKSK